MDNKKPKRNLGIKILSRQEIESHVPIFLSKAWMIRREHGLEKMYRKPKQTKGV